MCYLNFKSAKSTEKDANSSFHNSCDLGSIFHCSIYVLILYIKCRSCSVRFYLHIILMILIGNLVNQKLLDFLMGIVEISDPYNSDHFDKSCLK